MPTLPVNSSIAEAAANAASAGVQQAVTASAPDAFFRAFNRVFHPETTLRGTADIEIFNTLRAELFPLCHPDGESILPSQVMDCWKVFFFEESRGPVYTFTGVPDLKKCKDYYATYTPIEGRVRQDFPLTGAILGILSAIKSIQTDSKQTVAKIALGYIGLVSLALTEIDGPVQQYEVIELVKKVSDILMNSDHYRKHFDSAALAGLRELGEVLNDFLSLPHPTRDCEVLPRAMKRFQRYQLSIILKTFQTLLVLTEGGNKPSLTTNPKRIARGLLEDGSNITTFDPDNPFQEFLRFVAKSLDALHTQYAREPITEHVAIPTLKEVEDYLRKSLSKGARFTSIGTGRQQHSDDAVLYLLEQKAKGDGSQEVVWASNTDEAIIKTSAHHLRRIADWLRFHLYIGDKVVDMNAVMSMDGQSWLAQGEEADFVRDFMNRYQEMLHLFQRETGEVHAYLSRAIRTDMGAEHGIMRMLSSGLNQNVTHLVEYGLKPLLNIDERFTCLVSYIQEIRRRIFSNTAQFLNASGYGFSLRCVMNTETNEHSACMLRASDVNKASTVRPSPALFQTQKPDTVSFEKTKKVEKLLLSYAQTHGYIQEGPNGGRLLKGKDKMHQARAEWIQSIFDILNAQKTAGAIVFEVAGKIWELKESKSWSHFTQMGMGKTEIQECIAEIEKILFDNRMENPLFKSFTGESGEGIEMDSLSGRASINTTSANVAAFRRHDVLGDGDCGYRSFGIERLHAHQLLRAKLSSIVTLLQPAVQEALLTNDFYLYLVSKNATTLTHEQIESQLERSSTDLVIVGAYVDYDVLHKKIDKGWAHPCVLQALCETQKIELYLWRSIRSGARIIVPHQFEHADYAHHCPNGATQRLDLVFVNNNHFERLDPTERGERPDYVVGDAENVARASEESSKKTHNDTPPEADKPVTTLAKPIRLKPHFVYHLDKELQGLTAIEADPKKRADILNVLMGIAGLKGRIKKFAAVHAVQLRNLRYEQAKQYLRAELLAAYTQEEQSAEKESARQFLLKMHPQESEIHRVRRLPDDLMPYRGSYLFVTDSAQLLYIDQQVINTGLEEVSAIASLFRASTSIKIAAASLMKLIEPHGGQNPMLEVVKARSQNAQGLQAAHAYDTAKNDVLTSYVGSDSWLISESGSEYRTLLAEVERMLERTAPTGQERMASPEFLAEVKRHLLLDFMNRDERFEEESAALDELLTKLMNEFSSIPIKGAEDKQQRRAFYQAVILHLMALGANPLHWMRIQREKKEVHTAIIPEDASRSYLLAAQQVKLILSQLEHRANNLGETVILLGDKFNRLLQAVEQFAEHLYDCAGDEDQWVWNHISQLFKAKVPDGARFERTTLFWGILELIYTMINTGLELSEESDEQLTELALDKKGEKVRSFQTQQLRFKLFAESYIKRVNPELFGCNLHVLTDLPACDKLTDYRDSYLFCKKMNVRELYYVQRNSALTPVTIVDFRKFEEALNALKKKATDTLIPLTEEQIGDLVTENGGHVWSLQLDEQVMTQVLPGRISHRNYGRRTFVELFRAYSDVESEFERLAETRQHGREIFNAARTAFRFKAERDEAERRAEEAHRQKDEAIREVTHQADAAVRQATHRADEATHRAEEAMRQNKAASGFVITTLLSAKLSAACFQGVSSRERKTFYERRYAEVLTTMRLAFGQTITTVEQDILHQLRTPEYNHIRDLVPVEARAEAAVRSVGQNLFARMYSPRNADTDDLDAPLLGQRRVGK
jgi:hypothetical protein